MAKKKLFGGNIDPSCGICSHGKLSFDGKTVLCEHGGAVPAHHHCSRFQYDPLLRIPHRHAPLEDYSAEDFALGTAPANAETDADEIAALAAQQEELDGFHIAILDKLRIYLNETDAPDAQTILSILDDVPETDKLTVLDESDSDDAAENAEDDVPEQETPSLVIDDTPDIFEDLKQLTVTLDTSSTPAAFRSVAVHIAPDGHDDDDGALANILPDTDVLALPFSENDEDDMLSMEDLRFLSDSDLEDDETSAVTMNEDGSFSTHQK